MSPTVSLGAPPSRRRPYPPVRPNDRVAWILVQIPVGCYTSRGWTPREKARPSWFVRNQLPRSPYAWRGRWILREIFTRARRSGSDRLLRRLLRRQPERARARRRRERRGADPRLGRGGRRRSHRHAALHQVRRLRHRASHHRPALPEPPGRLSDQQVLLVARHRPAGAPVRLPGRSSGGRARLPGHRVRRRQQRRRLPSHKGLAIRGEDFDALVSDLVTVLQDLQVEQADIEALAPTLESLRGDIVTNSAPGLSKPVCDAGK